MDYVCLIFFRYYLFYPNIPVTKYLLSNKILGPTIFQLQ